MKKVLIIIALISFTGIVSSCSKENNVAPPTSISNAVNDDTDETGVDGKLGSADGGVDRPPVRKPR